MVMTRAQGVFEEIWKDFRGLKPSKMRTIHDSVNIFPFAHAMAQVSIAAWGFHDSSRSQLLGLLPLSLKTGIEDQAGSLQSTFSFHDCAT